MELLLLLTAPVAVFAGWVLLSTGMSARRVGAADRELYRAVGRLGGDGGARIGGVLVCDVVVQGRPVRLTCQTWVPRGPTFGRRTSVPDVEVTVSACIRHLDDVVAGVPAPPPVWNGWMQAWEAAHRRAAQAGLQRPELPPPVAEYRITDEVAAEKLVEIASRAVHVAEAHETWAAGWADGARALGGHARGAYVIDVEEAGCAVRMVADPVGLTIGYRCGAPGGAAVLAVGTAGPPGGCEHLPVLPMATLPRPYVLYAADPAAVDRLQPVIGALLACRPTSIIADPHATFLVHGGIVIDAERWRAAVAVMVGLTVLPSLGGVYR